MDGKKYNDQLTGEASNTDGLGRHGACQGMQHAGAPLHAVTELESKSSRGRIQRNGVTDH
jgi:hypothetical protein